MKRYYAVNKYWFEAEGQLYICQDLVIRHEPGIDWNVMHRTRTLDSDWTPWHVNKFMVDAEWDAYAKRVALGL